MYCAGRPILFFRRRFFRGCHICFRSSTNWLGINLLLLIFVVLCIAILSIWWFRLKFRFRLFRLKCFLVLSGIWIFELLCFAGLRSRKAKKKLCFRCFCCWLLFWWELNFRFRFRFVDVYDFFWGFVFGLLISHETEVYSRSWNEFVCVCFSRW